MNFYLNRINKNWPNFSWIVMLDSNVFWLHWTNLCKSSKKKSWPCIQEISNHWKMRSKVSTTQSHHFYAKFEQFWAVYPLLCQSWNSQRLPIFSAETQILVFTIILCSAKVWIHWNLWTQLLEPYWMGFIAIIKL